MVTDWNLYHMVVRLSSSLALFMYSHPRQESANTCARFTHCKHLGGVRDLRGEHHVVQCPLVGGVLPADLLLDGRQEALQATFRASE